MQNCTVATQAQKEVIKPKYSPCLKRFFSLNDDIILACPVLYSNLLCKLCNQEKVFRVLVSYGSMEDSAAEGFVHYGQK